MSKREKLTSVIFRYVRIGLRLFFLTLVVIAGFSLVQVFEVKDNARAIVRAYAENVKEWYSGGVEEFPIAEDSHVIIIRADEGNNISIQKLDNKESSNLQPSDLSLTSDMLADRYEGDFAFAGKNYVGIIRLLDSKENTYFLSLQSISNFAERIDRQTMVILVIFFVAQGLCIILYSRYLVVAGTSKLFHFIKLFILSVVLGLIFMLANKYILVLNNAKDLVNQCSFLEESVEMTVEQFDQLETEMDVEKTIYVKEKLESTLGCYILTFDDTEDHEKMLLGGVPDAEDVKNLAFCSNFPEDTDSYNYSTSVGRTKYFVHMFYSKKLSRYIALAFKNMRLWDVGGNQVGFNFLTVITGLLIIVLFRQLMYNRISKALEKVSGLESVIDEKADGVVNRFDPLKIELKQVRDLKNVWLTKTPEQKLTVVFQLALCYIMVEILLLVVGDNSDTGSILGTLLSGSWQRGISWINISFILVAIVSIAVTFGLMKKIIVFLAVPFGRKVETYSKLVVSIIQYGLIFAFIFYGTYLLGMEIKNVGTLAAVATGVIGFGAQALISDIGAGFLMMAEGTLMVGDRVCTAGIKGVIKDIGIRQTVIEGDDGSITSISNSNMKMITILPRDGKAEVKKAETEVEINDVFEDDDDEDGDDEA